MQHYHRVEDIPVHAVPHGRLRLLSGPNLMAFWAEWDANTHVDRHAHPNEQITWLIAGRMDFKIGDEPVRSCGSGSVVVVPADVPHEVWYREPCTIFEMFNPPRADLFPAIDRNPYGIA